jgi:hypothetical protein
MRTAWFLVLVLLASSAQAATRYVSPGGSNSRSCEASTSRDQSKQSLNGAQGALACMKSGDTLYLLGGTYREALVIPKGGLPNGGGSWDKATTIAGAPPERPILRPPAGTFTSTTLSLGQGGGFAWMIFANLEMNGTDMGSCSGCGQNIMLGGDSHHIRIQDCDIHHGPSHNIFGGGSHHEFLGNRVHDARGYGWYFSGNHALFDGNEVWYMGGYGMHIYNTGATDVSDNVVSNNRVHDNGYGKYQDPPRGGTGMLVSHGNNNIVVNNLIYNNAQGLEIDHSCTNCQYLHNTIVGNTGAGVTLGVQYPQSLPGLVFANNLVAENTPNFYDPNHVPGTFSHTLCSRAGVHCDLVGNPAFVEAAKGNFQLLGISDARNAAQTLESVRSSFYSVARQPSPPGGATDIGAAEYEEEDESHAPVTANAVYVRTPAKGGKDTNDCTAAEKPATAKATITSALGCMTVPGKVLRIEAGIYTEEIDTKKTPITGGTAEAMTRIEGYGVGPTILQSPEGGGTTLFLRSPTDTYLHFKRLIVDGANRTYNTVALYATAEHVRFEQVEVKNVRDGNEGVYILGSDHVELIDVFVHDTGSHGLRLEGDIGTFLCERCHLYNAKTTGVSIDATGTKKAISVRNSELRNNGGDAVDLGSGASTQLANLLIQGNGSMGVRIRTGARGVRLESSTIYSNTGNGVQCDPGASGVVLLENIIYGNAGGGANNVINNCGATVEATIERSPSARID